MSTQPGIHYFFAVMCVFTCDNSNLQNSVHQWSLRNSCYMNAQMTESTASKRHTTLYICFKNQPSAFFLQWLRPAVYF